MPDTPWSPPQHLYLLDALRGLAAWSVVLWHWQHFFLPLNQEGLPFVRGRQPFYDELALLYDDGAKAVQVFFCLSGFVFFWLYERRITHGGLLFREFFVLRFSRLYPLHLATLLFVAAGQLIYRAATGNWFVYLYNDPFHFLLNLAFASSWGFEAGQSFNGPVWSVSVEVLLYLLFFVVCRLRLARNAVLLLLCLIGARWGLDADTPVGSGLACFFLGGLTYRAYAALIRGRYRDQALWGCLSLAILAWGWTLHVRTAALQSLLGPPLPFGQFIAPAWPVFVLYPLTILALALANTRWRGGRPLSMLGNLSYASYLIHFPLQLVVVTLALPMQVDRDGFTSPVFFVMFFLVLIGLSAASHARLEMPAQRWIRSRWRTSSPAA